MGKRLPHVAYCILGSPSFDNAVRGGQAPIAVAEGKDEERGNWVADVGKERADVEGGAEFGPLPPRCTGLRNAALTDSMEDFLPDSVEISNERIAGVGWTIFHGRF